VRRRGALIMAVVAALSVSARLMVGAMPTAQHSAASTATTNLGGGQAGGTAPGASANPRNGKAPGTASGTPTAASATPTATPSTASASDAATSTPGPALSSGPPPTVSCVNNAGRDTTALLNAISRARVNAVITIGAGTCALDSNLPLHSPVTIDGAGAQRTFMVQHASTNIFQITSPYVTVENINLNTASGNPGVIPLGTQGSPAVLFSAQSHTSVLNVTAEAGDGFGMRISGPNPCSTYHTTGTVVSNLTISNAGNGGRAALDIDCTNGARLSNITIPTGNYIALFQDENVSLTNEHYTPFSTHCHEPWYVTGPAHNISITNVWGGGHGVIAAPTSNVTVSNQVFSPGC
jgi:hypothetical protein